MYKWEIAQEGTEHSLATILQAYYVFQKHFSPILILLNPSVTQTDEYYCLSFSIGEPGPEKLKGTCLASHSFSMAEIKLVVPLSIL